MHDLDRISSQHFQKLVIHQDPGLFDENGIAKEPSRGQRGGRKKKTMDVNETQISKSLCHLLRHRIAIN